MQVSVGSTSVRTSPRAVKRHRMTQTKLRDRGALTTAEAAAYIGLGLSTLANMRVEGKGPRYAKIGKSVLYRPCDLDDYIARNIVK